MPIICIASDARDQKLKPISQHVQTIQFDRPTRNEVVKRVLTICKAQNIPATSKSIEVIAESCGCDMRQVINQAQIMTCSGGKLHEESARKALTQSGKDAQIMESPMEVVRKLLTSARFAQMTMDQRLDCFFVDYDFMPLVIQQNYIMAVQQEYNFYVSELGIFEF